MRRTKSQCKARNVPLKLVHGDTKYDLKTFEVKPETQRFELATVDFKKKIDPAISVSYILIQNLVLCI